MKQTPFMSAVESLTNVVCGFVVSALAQAVIMWMLGIPVTLHEQAVISATLTVISLVRSYALRRAFERLKT